VEWALPELRPGEQKTYRVPVAAAKLSDRATLTVAVAADAVNNGRTVGEPVIGKAESEVAIIGTPAMSLEVQMPQGLIEVGKRVTVKVRVKNSGTVSARKVEPVAFAPPELRPIRGNGASQGADGAAIAPMTARLDGTGRIAFPAIEELRPGETLTFTVDLDAVQAGDARFRVEVAAAHLTNPLKEEQAFRITAK
jgi:hypothetical protein